MKSIVWIASYPKSGNTWLRVFLANYISNPSEPLSINKLDYLNRIDADGRLYKLVSKEPYDGNNPIQSAQLRPAVLKTVVANDADINFLKSHSRNSIAYGVRLIPPELTRCAIYIVRNPLDMVVSYANHYNISIDKAISGIGRSNNALKGGTGTNNAYQFLGSWSDHVKGWAEAKDIPVMVVRYEDMLKNPYQAFQAVLRHIGLPVKREQLEKAIQFSNFEVLQQQEEKNGFKEAVKTQELFFRSGKSEQWKTELNEDQVAQILQDHGRVMKKFGYEV